MAEKENINSPKDLIEPVPEEVGKLEKQLSGNKRLSREERDKKDLSDKLSSWAPKTELGKKVKKGEIKDIDLILKEYKKILESEISDTLLRLDSDLLLIGQAKGKFGGGKRRAWRQTQRKTMEGNIVTFSCMVVVGDRSGHVGLGFGKAKETLPSREKAIRNAKLNIIKVVRGFESPEFEKDLSDPHTVPFKISGRCGSSRITIIPAPRGTGLVAADEVKKILRLAGIKDAYTRTSGQTRTTFNLAKATVDALNKTNQMRL